MDLDTRSEEALTSVVPLEVFGQSMKGTKKKEKRREEKKGGNSRNEEEIRGEEGSKERK